jgi:hypothetical protein
MSHETEKEQFRKFLEEFEDEEKNLKIVEITEIAILS